jgi:hypothetical protein
LLVTLEGGYDKARTPRSKGFGLIRSASTRPRPGLDAQHSTTGKGGRYGAAPRVISAPRPLRHHVSGDGLPFLGHVATVLSNRDRQNIVSRPHRLGLLPSYKREGRGSTKKEPRYATDGHPAIYKIEINVSSNHLVLLFLLLRPGFTALSRKLVTPTQAPRCKEIQISPSPRWT